MVDESGQLKGNFRTSQTSAMSDDTDKSAWNTRLLGEEALVAVAYTAILSETGE